MQVPLDDVHFPAHLRLRSETYGDIQGLTNSMATYGQLMPIILREVDPELHPDDEGVEEPYVLVDGGRRFLAAQLALRLSKKDESEEPIRFGDVEPGYLHARVVTADNPLLALRMEFHANEDREGFSWKEKAEYVERVHASCQEEFGEDVWTHEHTAEFLGMGRSTVQKYLKLTEDEEIMKDEKVSGAKTFRTAYKQAEIAREKKKRQRRAKHHKKVVEETSDKDESFEEKLQRLSLKMVIHGDCREWIETLEDESQAWIHWDPPYGGEQSGGAFSPHEQIDDSPEYAAELFTDMLPELYRVLEDGRWMALWFHPAMYQQVRKALEEAGFWVNPYPCVWYKQNRMSDGHEIRRFLVNAYETFFLCGKGEMPILQASNVQNVFAHDMPVKSTRRHVMHKPKELLKDILKIISIPGESGIDPSVGSGSIMEAAIETGRKPEGCEISEEYWLGAVETTRQALENLGK